MNLSLFFEPVEEAVVDLKLSAGNMRDQLRIHTGELPQSGRIALFGVPEYRGTVLNETFSEGIEAIRYEFYRLKKGKYIDVSDYGNLKPGPTLEDTQLRLKEVCDFFLTKGIIPLIIGGGHDLTLGQARAYEGLDHPINLVNIDARFDFDELALDGSFLPKLLETEEPLLYTYIHLAYQSYLVRPEVLNTFEKLYFEGVRLGQLREDISEVEPVLRGADACSFDLSAIRYGEMTGASGIEPFGLTSEEACQLCWYAGLSDQLTSFGLYDYNGRNDELKLGAKTAAIMLWYFIEGVAHRNDTRNFQSAQYTKYNVTLANGDHELIFYKNQQSSKWWIEIEEGRVIPCSYSDYEMASKGEIPERWWKNMLI